MKNVFTSRIHTTISSVNLHEVLTYPQTAIHRQREARSSHNRSTCFIMKERTTTTLLSWGRTWTSAFWSAFRFDFFSLLFFPLRQAGERRFLTSEVAWHLFSCFSNRSRKSNWTQGEKTDPKGFPHHIHSGWGRFLLNPKVHIAKLRTCMKAEN